MATPWKKFVKERSNPVETRFLGGRFKDRELLIRALTRNAVLNEKLPYEEFKTNGSQKGLDTIGDTVLNFFIIDHFSQKSRKSPKINYSPEDLTIFKVSYGNNFILHKFSRDSMELQKYIIWGNDEEKSEKWKTSRRALADCFESLVGAIYLDRGMDGVKKFLKKIRFFQNMDEVIKT